MKQSRTKCWYCDLDALDGHLTCGQAICSESMARAEAHSARRGLSPRGGRPRSGRVMEAEPEHALATRACGNTNAFVPVSCGRSPDHEGVHVSGRLKWSTGGRPYPVEDDELARLGAVQPQADSERLAELLQVLITCRGQMLGLGEGLKKALGEMPRAVDKQAVAGLIGALSHIVQHLDRFKVMPGETVLHEKSRMGADRITASEFDRRPGSVSSATVSVGMTLQPGRSAPVEVSFLEESTKEKLIESFVAPVRQSVAELERRLEAAETARRQDGAAALSNQYAADRERLGRALTRREEALLVSAVRGLWGGPAFGGDWVDRELENLASDVVKTGYDALERLGYFAGERVAFRGVRAAVVAMDRENLVEAESAG